MRQDKSQLVHDTLASFQRYLSDTIPPLLASEALEILMQLPPNVLAEAISKWAVEQTRCGYDARLPNLYLLASRKLREFDNLGLIPTARLISFLAAVHEYLVLACPEEDRPQLKKDLSLLEQPGDPTLSGIRSARSEPREDSSRPGAEIDVLRQNRELSRLLQRFTQIPLPEPAVRSEANSPDTSSLDQKEELASQVVGETLRNVHSAEELRRVEELLGGLGLSLQAESVFRVIARSLPEWNIAALDVDPESVPTNRPIEAMRRVVELAENKQEVSLRWQKLVEASLEQLEQGSLAKASMMIGLADSLARDAPSDSAVNTAARKKLQKRLDIESLRPFLEDVWNHSQVCNLLSFFDDYQPKGLLKSLRDEPKRARRRLLRDLLEIFGEGARGEVLACLRQELSSAGAFEKKVFLQDLVSLLYLIRPSGGEPLEHEFDSVEKMLDPALPPELVREAILYFGTFRTERPEEILIRVLHQLEDLLLARNRKGGDAKPLQALLTECTFCLAKLGTKRAVRAVRVHGLGKLSGLGDTLERLTHLSALDLNIDPETVSEITKAAGKSLPRRLLGLKVGGDLHAFRQLVTAMSATRSTDFNLLMEEVTARFSTEELGRIAAKYLEASNGERPAAGEDSVARSGTLNLYGLPVLLRRFERSGASGILSLHDAGNEIAGILMIREGAILSCRAGSLTGETAFYRLFEKPVEGTFAFQPRKDLAAAPDSLGKALGPLVLEGVKRHDQYRWLRAVVSDRAAFVPKSEEPPDVGEPGSIAALLWRQIGEGSTPADCELQIDGEPLELRRLLVRWVEQGLLEEIPLTAKAEDSEPGSRTA